MKFVALALALLLAVGSQAASLQADEPSQLEHVRAAMDIYLQQVMDSLTKVLDHLDDTEYNEYKVTLSEGLVKLQQQLKVAQQSVSPYTDSISRQIMEATASIRKSIETDMDALNTQLGPKHLVLKEVMEKHLKAYHDYLEPIIQELKPKYLTEMDDLKARLQPRVTELQTLVVANVEETKTALLPIVEALKAKLMERLGDLRSVAAPYVEEYKDHLNTVFSQFDAGEIKTQVSTHIDNLKLQASPLAEDAKAKLTALYETLVAAITAEN